MTTPAWMEWFEFEDHAVVIGGKRLPATFEYGRTRPQDFPEEPRWGVTWVPIENGLHVSFYGDLSEYTYEFVVAEVVEYAPKDEPLPGFRDWSLCPHEDGDPRHYRRCRVGPHRENYLEVDYRPSLELTRQECRTPEDCFDILRWGSTLYVDQPER